MSDANYEKSKENSPEYVAYRLLRDIMMAEGKSLIPGSAEKTYILDTYAEALAAVRNPEGYLVDSKRADRSK